MSFYKKIIQFLVINPILSFAIGFLIFSMIYSLAPIALQKGFSVSFFKWFFGSLAVNFYVIPVIFASFTSILFMRLFSKSLKKGDFFLYGIGSIAMIILIALSLPAFLSVCSYLLSPLLTLIPV